MKENKSTQKPKIVHVHPRYLGTSETFIHRLISNLDNFNNMVFTEEINNLDFYPNRSYAIYKVGDEDQIKFRVFSKIVRSIYPRYSGYCSLHSAYSQQFLKHRPKLIHAHYGHVGWFCLPIAKLHKVPLVVSFHGIDASAFFKHSSWKQRFQELFGAADHFVVPSDFVKNSLINSGCDKTRIHVFRYGVNLDEWTIKSQKNVQKNEKLNILMVSRLVEKKGIKYAIQAMERVITKIPQAQLSIIGDGLLKPKIIKLIDELGLEKNIHLLGKVPNAEVALTMKKSDILIAPSVTSSDGDKEGLPSSIIEALATAIPVVATNHAGIPEVVIDGLSGYLVPERDVINLADRIIRLLEDPVLRFKMGKEGRLIVEKSFDIRGQGEKLESLYNDVIHKYRLSQGRNELL